ncbi:NGG1 interacting factor Nif3 [Lineolata rhizophorae]|uniref:NGG1 interacting factor Nif3 n=1 Tax=Lineolata rhizophorae TaxID=578093 RepID=A0A6A6NUU4_9PEZI|nr:NGG1 interacting factor Nif3 [Lineolata rhizophorae]
MAASAARCAPFSRAVVNSIRKLYPEALADKSWDNTGLLLEAPFDPARRRSNTVLLTIDLTKAVVDEAIELDASVIVSYHPIIFKGLKSITLANGQQQSLLRLAAEGISVYSPHSAIDAAPGGLNDWLADIITGTPAVLSQKSSPRRSRSPAKAFEEDDDPFVVKGGSAYKLQHHPSPRLQPFDRKLTVTSAAHDRDPVVPLQVEGAPGAGTGRIVKFKERQTLSILIDRVARGLGKPKGFPVAVPQGKSITEITVSSVGICAGSGGGLLSGLDVDLLFTGELSHHEALAAIERGTSVITLFHSNSERGFLDDVLRTQLEESVSQEWDRLRADENDGSDAFQDDEVTIEVSEQDRDPYGIVVQTG